MSGPKWVIDGAGDWCLLRADYSGRKMGLVNSSYCDCTSLGLCVAD